MYPICAAQIKAARAYLDWSQSDLAEATGLSTKTVRNLEMGFISPRSATNNVVRKALEDKGIEFLESGGVRRRIDEVKTYQGPDSCEMFFDDVLQTIRAKGGEIHAIVRSQEMLAQICGATLRGSAEWMKQLGAAAPVRCILSEAPVSSFFTPSFQFRINPNKSCGSVSSFVYGGKYAIAVAEDGGVFKFVVMQSIAIAQGYDDSFLELWGRAAPVLIQASSPPQRTPDQRTLDQRTST